MDTQELTEQEAEELAHHRLGGKLRERLVGLQRLGFTHAIVMCRGEDSARHSMMGISVVEGDEIFRAQEKIRGRGLKPQEVVDLRTFEVRDGLNPHVHLK